MTRPGPSGRRRSPPQQLADLPIIPKLLLVSGGYVVMMLIVLALSAFGMITLSGARAYVGGEGLWAKAQKDAVYHLRKYAMSRSERDYQRFLDFMAVPAGIHEARLALERPEPDMRLADQGFIKGRNHPADVRIMGRMFRWFGEISFMKKAIGIWKEAETETPLLLQVADALHQEIGSAQPSEALIQRSLEQIDAINVRLTVLEDTFSFTLGEAARWMTGLLIQTMLLAGLAMLGCGLSVAFVIGRQLGRDVRAVRDGAARVARGDFSQRIAVASRDEIGQLAQAFNAMTDSLVDTIGRLRATEAELRGVNGTLEQRVEERTRELQRLSQELARSNEDLEQFAYVASHDLQEPLRMVASYTQLLARRYRGRLDPDAEEFIRFAVDGVLRMQRLITDLLAFSRAGRAQKPPEPTDCAAVVQQAITNLALAIQDSGAQITTGPLPVVRADASQLGQVFQNLLSNALKYRQPAAPCRIEVRATRQGRLWQFTIADNGIGLDMQYATRIFVIFERLHAQAEYPGTGIGLAVCKKIVERHGGRIWVESAPGQGARFCFTLPAELSHAPGRDAEAQDDRPLAATPSTGRA